MNCSWYGKLLNLIDSTMEKSVFTFLYDWTTVLKGEDTNKLTYKNVKANRFLSICCLNILKRDHHSCSNMDDYTFLCTFQFRKHSSCHKYHSKVVYHGDKG